MKSFRTINIYQNEKEIGKLRGSNGYRLCRWCHKEVQPPRKTFCSDACVHEWRLRSSISYLRKHVYDRDRGICAICNTDTRLIRIKIEDKYSEVLRIYGMILFESSYEWESLSKELKLSKIELLKSLWQADHINPVADNKGVFPGLEGYRTLCIHCHKQVTREWQKTRKKLKNAKISK